MPVSRSIFGEFNGKEIFNFTLTNAKGNSISIINYGATIISWLLKDNNNAMRNIVAGFDKLEDYLINDVYLGCTVGRYANRIANGRFEIDGIQFDLASNNGVNHLHGGDKGFDKVTWDAAIIDPADTKLSLTYFSKDGEEGYPGNLKVRVDYIYTDEDELLIEYYAETDKKTTVNLTNHSYFNLTGDFNKKILDHSLQINAAFYTAVNENLIPTGELKPVNNTAFDFNTLKKISDNFNNTENGFDLNYVLKKGMDEMPMAGLLCDPENKLQLSVFTTEPGMQFYSGNLLNGNLINRDGKPIRQHGALCLETQHFPDSPNQPQFPSTILLPGNTFRSKTGYKISITE
ncbi:MAG: aldose epimerase family protein [Ferruginibacter sp.]